MSDPQRRQPDSAVRAKRQTTLPTHLQDYVLSGWRSSSKIAACFSDDDGQDSSRDLLFPSSRNQLVQLHDDMEELLRQKKDLRETHQSLQAAMDDLKLRNYDLNRKTRQSEYRLEQLTRRSTMETDQLHAQIKHLGEAVQQLQPDPSPSAIHREGDQMTAPRPEAVEMPTPHRASRHLSGNSLGNRDSPHSRSPQPRESISGMD